MVECSSHNPKTLGSNPLVAAKQSATLLRVAGNETQVGKLHWAIITALKVLSNRSKILKFWLNIQRLMKAEQI